MKRKANTINTYGYCVLKRGNIPLHVVQIYHYMYHGFCVFNSANDAREFIERQKASLDAYAPLEYDADFYFSRTLCNCFTSADYVIATRLSDRQLLSFGA